MLAMRYQTVVCLFRLAHGDQSELKRLSITAHFANPLPELQHVRRFC
jgi:hypothetical protein